jgi:hypothetical protein
MHSQFFYAALLASSVIAVPLNINLGAYSPALVVGDGEISFGGKQDVSNLMNALEGAAVSGAAAANAPAAAAPAPAPAAAAPIVAVAPAPVTQAQAAPAPALAPAPPVDQTTQITALQGMGKEIAPRVIQLVKEGTEKRDINGFNAALKYASDALKNSPTIQLGTEAAGVGIIQGAGVNAAKPGAAKRDELPNSLKMKTTVTTMFVRGGPAPVAGGNVGMYSLHLLLNETKTDHCIARSIEDSSTEKRAPIASPGVDGVNLNMAGGQVAELTFVETREVDEKEE